MRLAAAGNLCAIGIQRTCSLELFFLGDHFARFRELKQLYTVAEWDENLPGILESLKRHCRAYPQFLSLAGMYEELLAFLRNYPSTLDLFRYELLPEHADEIYDIYREYILREASYAENRNQYQDVTAIIRGLIGIGGTEPADCIIETLRTLYKRKRAFMDELNRIEKFPFSSNAFDLVVLIPAGTKKYESKELPGFIQAIEAISGPDLFHPRDEDMVPIFDVLLDGDGNVVEGDE